MRTTRFAVVGFLAVFSACSGEQPTLAPETTTKFQEDWSSGVACAGAQQRLIRDHASWGALWAQTHPDGEPVPGVDFQVDSVLAGCAVGSGGDYYEVTAWTPASTGEVTAYETRVGLGSGCLGTLQVTTSFHAIRIEGAFASANFVTTDAGREACGTLDVGDAPGWKPLADGYFSGCTAASEQLIRSEEDWAAFWTLLHADTVQEPERPAVDFANESVIATCLGTRQDGGYATRLRHMTDPDADGRVVVGVRDYVAAADCGEPVVTQAFHLIRVNRPLGGVTFRRRTILQSCADAG